MARHLALACCPFVSALRFRVPLGFGVWAVWSSVAQCSCGWGCGGAVLGVAHAHSRPAVKVYDIKDRGGRVDSASESETLATDTPRCSALYTLCAWMPATLILVCRERRAGKHKQDGGHVTPKPRRPTLSTRTGTRHRLQRASYTSEASSSTLKIPSVLQRPCGDITSAPC